MKKLTKKLFISAILAVSSCAFISSTPQFSTLAMEAQSDEIKLSKNFCSFIYKDLKSNNSKDNESEAYSSFIDEISNLVNQFNHLKNKIEQQLKQTQSFIEYRFSKNSNFYKASRTFEDYIKSCSEKFNQVTTCLNNSLFYNDIPDLIKIKTCILNNNNNISKTEIDFLNYFNLLIYYCLHLNNIKLNLNNFENNTKKHNIDQPSNSDCFAYLDLLYNTSENENKLSFTANNIYFSIDLKDKFLTWDNLIKKIPQKENYNPYKKSHIIDEPLINEPYIIARNIKLSSDFKKGISTKNNDMSKYIAELASLKEQFDNSKTEIKQQLKQTQNTIKYKYSENSNFYKASQTFEDHIEKCSKLLDVEFKTAMDILNNSKINVEYKLNFNGLNYYNNNISEIDRNFLNSFHLILYYCLHFNNIKRNFDIFDENVDNFNSDPPKNHICFNYINLKNSGSTINNRLLYKGNGNYCFSIAREKEFFVQNHLIKEQEKQEDDELMYNMAHANPEPYIKPVDIKLSQKFIENLKNEKDKKLSINDYSSEISNLKGQFNELKNNIEHNLEQCQYTIKRKFSENSNFYYASKTIKEYIERCSNLLNNEFVTAESILPKINPYNKLNFDDLNHDNNISEIDRNFLNSFHLILYYSLILNNINHNFHDFEKNSLHYDNDPPFDHNCFNYNNLKIDDVSNNDRLLYNIADGCRASIDRKNKFFDHVSLVADIPFSEEDDNFYVNSNNIINPDNIKNEPYIVPQHTQVNNNNNNKFIYTQLDDDFIKNLQDRNLTIFNYAAEISNLNAKFESLKKEVEQKTKEIQQNVKFNSLFYEASKKFEDSINTCSKLFIQKFEKANSMLDDVQIKFDNKLNFHELNYNSRNISEFEENFLNNFHLMLYYILHLDNINYNLNRFQGQIDHYNNVPSAECDYYSYKGLNDNGESASKRILYNINDKYNISIASKDKLNIEDNFVCYEEMYFTNSFHIDLDKVTLENAKS